MTIASAGGSMMRDIRVAKVGVRWAVFVRSRIVALLVLKIQVMDIDLFGLLGH